MCKLCSPVRATAPFIYAPGRHTPSTHVYLDGLPLRRLFHRGHEGPCTPPPNPIRLSIGRLLCPAPPPQATEPFPCLPGGWMPPVHAHPTAVPLRRPFHRGREGPGNPADLPFLTQECLERKRIRIITPARAQSPRAPPGRPAAASSTCPSDWYVPSPPLACGREGPGNPANPYVIVGMPCSGRAL